MKYIYLIPVILLTACASKPKPLPLYPATVTESGIRYPETIRAYNVGRYTDPGNQTMHEEHTIYRVEDNTRWDFHPPAGGTVSIPSASPQDATFSPMPVNDTIIAEVNAQRLATAQVTQQAKMFSAALAQVQAALQETQTNLQADAALRSALEEVKQRLNALEAGQLKPSTFSPTNETSDPFRP